MIDENENYQHVSEDARKIWAIHACIGTLFFLGVAIGVYLTVFRHIWIYGVIALYAIITIFIMPSIEYQQWLYFIGEDRIEIIHGIFFKKRALIPINRIQHLKIQQGVIQKKFKLASVDIYTAGGNHQIKALVYEEADEIVRKLNHLVIEEVESKETPVIDKEGSHEA